MRFQLVLSALIGVVALVEAAGAGTVPAVGDGERDREAAGSRAQEQGRGQKQEQKVRWVGGRASCARPTPISSPTSILVSITLSDAADLGSTLTARCFRGEGGREGSERGEGGRERRKNRDSHQRPYEWNL